MTDDQINELVAMVSNEPSDAELRAFARAVAEKEREACIEIVLSEIRPGDEPFTKLALHTAGVKIRARGE